MHKAYVASSKDRIPADLKDRKPYPITDVRISFCVDREEALAEDGMVALPGAVEFRTVITPGELSAVCDPNELWSSELADTERFRSTFDPEIQRGEKQKAGGLRSQILNQANLDSMVQDIRKNEFECSELTWNLRFGEVLWVYVEDDRELLIYEGVGTRPDTNHRHHAIIGVHKEYRKWVRETGDENYLDYNPKREYGLAIYTADFSGEANKFYKWNSKGSKVAAGKAHYVSSLTNDPNAHAKLANDLMRNCGVLTVDNVEIPSSSLSKNSAKMVLFYTLVRGLQTAFPSIPSEEPNRGDLLQYLTDFVAELGKVRPNEIVKLSVEKRQQVRANSIADQAITWIAYFQLAADLFNDADWHKKLAVLGQPLSYDTYTGDLLSRNNPLWQSRGILAPSASGKLKVISNRNAQQQMIATLREVVANKGVIAPPAAPAVVVGI